MNRRQQAQLARLDLLILDDFGIAPIAAHERNDLLELLDDRVGTRSTLITSQLPVTAWHAWLDEPQWAASDLAAGTYFLRVQVLDVGADSKLSHRAD